MSEGMIGVRRRRGAAEAMSLVAEYEASGVSRRLFCAARGLSVATLDLYRKRARQEAKGSVRTVPPRLVAVEIKDGGTSGCVSSAQSSTASSSQSGVLTVVLKNGRRIEVGGVLDSDLLLHLVVVLERA